MNHVDEKKSRSLFSRQAAFAAYDWVSAMVGALVALVLLFTFLIRIVGVDGDSMEPTLQDGDRLVLTRVETSFERGDIIVVDRYAIEPLIKRVIAVEGDVVEITAGCELLINGEVQHEAYIQGVNVPRDMTEPVTVPAGYVFVMGDNRTVSKDSRMAEVGMVSVKDIVGKAVFRHWPLHSLGGVYDNLEDNLGE